jgi:acyl-CoA dehydrogenase
MDFIIPEDLKMLQTLARDFVKDQLIPLEKEVLGRESDLEGSRQDLAPEKEAELVRIARETGLWGLSLPEHLGGIGPGVLGICLVEEELARTVLPFNLGDVTPVLYDCNEEQKSKYLLPLLEREKSACLALMEPGEGIDPSVMEMRAYKKNGNFSLNGRKIAFTRRRKFDFAIVFAVTEPEKGPRSGVTCFLVDSDTDGFTAQVGGEKTGWQAQVLEPLVLTFENCPVAAKQVLGEEGKAFHLGAKWLPIRRIIRGARCVGAASRLLEKASEHARSWVSFGQTISNWPVIQSLLAEMAIDIKASRLLVYQAACRADEGQEIHREAAGVKVFTTEMLKRVADKSVLIKSGPGPLLGLPLEFLCQSLLAQNMGARALEVQKSILAEEVLRLGKVE